MKPGTDRRPELCETGHSLIVTFVPPLIGGSSVLMHNLLTRFDPASLTVATLGNTGTKNIAGSTTLVSHEIFKAQTVSQRLNDLLFSLQLPYSVRLLTRIARSVDARVMVGCYPDYHLLAAARAAARKLQIPWVAYLHDTILESVTQPKHESRVRRLQEAVFEEASHLAVMSEGMADLYVERYGFDRPTALEHIYPEPVEAAVDDGPYPSTAFWGGSVYEINAQGVGRVSRAVSKAGIRLHLATHQSLTTLQTQGLDVGSAETSFYADRRDYLSALRAHGVMILALDWPDESSVREEELSTIFPTKTPEYLASGRPILVHCPRHYFLAKFFENRDCGTVISERSDDALSAAIRTVLAGSNDVSRKIRNALSAAGLFDPNRVSTRFKTIVDTVSGARWGEKVRVPLDDE